MRIALLGTRGIPANTAASKPSPKSFPTRLVARGHEVTVYCREPYEPPEYRGVHLIYLPTIRHKYFDTLAHTFLSTLHLLRASLSTSALYCNAANAIFTILPRLAGMPVALNVDGIERKRKKWNAFARAWYLVSEWLATILPNCVRDRRRSNSRILPAALRQGNPCSSLTAPMRNEWKRSGALAQLGLEPGKYFLYVSRMEPENHALEVRQAFEQLRDGHEARADRRCAVRAGLHPRRCATRRIRAS